MIGLEEAKEMQINAQLAGVIGDFDDITQGGNGPGGIIGEVLEVIENNFYLVPKNGRPVDGGVVYDPVPEGALLDSLFDLWSKVAN